jgi:hypothetical protein
MTLLDWTFYVGGIFCCLESARFGRFKERAFMVGVGLFSAAIIAASIGCADVPTAPTSSYTPAPVGDGSARVSTLSVLDHPLVNSCDTSSFRIHQKPGEHGQLATVFEERPGPFNTAWDVEYQRRNNVLGKPNDYVGALTQRARGYTSIVEVQINAGGVYQGRMKGNRCANWSAWIEFAIAGPEPEPEPASACALAPWTPNCVAWEE